jgi:hypothetical protein
LGSSFLKKPLLLFAGVALLYAGPGLLPGRRLVPADIPRDLLAWKGDPSIRVRVSNSLLSDVPLQSIPWEAEARRLVLSGEMPWINRYSGTTEHLFANPSAGILSPFTWLRILLGLRGWAWTVFFKIITAALCACWFARTLGADWYAARLSGLVYALSGFAIVWAEWPHTNVFVLLPALAAAAVEVARQPSPRRIFVAAMVATLATAGGHPETLLVGVIAIFAFLLITGRRVAPFAAASFAGFLLIGIHIVPFVIALRDSHAIHTRSQHLQIHFRPLTLLSELLPGALGSPLRDEIDLTGPITIAEYFNQRTGGFIGAIVLMALIVSFPRLSGDHRRALSIALVAFALTLAIPGISHALKLIPPLRWVAFEYFQVAFVLLASAAAGPALLRVAQDARRPRLGGALIVAAAALLVAGVLPSVAPRQLESAARAVVLRLQVRGYLRLSATVYEQRLSHYIDGAQTTALRRLALPAFCWLIAGSALTMAASRRRETLLAIAAAGELLAFGVGFNPSIRIDEIAREPRAIAEIRRRDPGQRWLTASSNDVFPPNLGTTFGVRQSHAYDILTSETDTRKLMAAGYEPDRWALPPDPSPAQMFALAELGVRFYVTPQGLTELPNPRLPPAPRNDPPRGLFAGALVSLAGGVLLAATMRHYSHSIVDGGFDEMS